MARTRGWLDAYRLIDAGVPDVYRETLDSALRMAADAMHNLGFRRYQTHRAVKTFRRHDEKFLLELAEMRHDHKELIRGTRQRIEDLEKQMLFYSFHLSYSSLLIATHSNASLLIINKYF